MSVGPSSEARNYLPTYIQKIESEIFNRDILNHCVISDELKTCYSLKDPRIIVLYLLYTEYSPVSCYGYI